MQRRKFMLGMGAVAAGGAAALGTGAFTSVQADRSLSVNVAGDSDAFLRLMPSDGPNGRYAEITNNTLELNFDDEAQGVGGSGLNDQARTIIRNVFEIRNSGTQSVYVWAQNLPDGVGIFTDNDPDGESLGLEGNPPTSNPPPTPVDVEVGVGEVVGEIGFSFDTSNDDSHSPPGTIEDFTGNITLMAKAVSSYP